MAKESDKVRLPELPVFKRFSLALRQEYASADEVLAVIDRTVTRINTLLSHAEETRRRAETPAEPEEPEEEEVEEIQTDAEEEEVLSVAAADAELMPAEEPPDEETKEQEIESLLKGPEPDVDSLFPIEEEEVDSFVPAEADEISSLIRPESEPEVLPPPKPKPKPKPKRKRAQPEIVRVSKLGKPLGLSKVKAKPAASKGKSTARNRRTKSR